MSDNANAPDRVLDLAEAVCDESVSAKELAELDSLVMADEASRRDYWDYCRMHISLEMEMRARRAVQRVQQRGDSASVLLAPWESEALTVAMPVDAAASRPPVVSVPVGALHPATGYFFSGWPVAYLVATVIFGFGLLIGGIVHVSDPMATVRQGPSNPTRAGTALEAGIETESIGQITGMVDCRWADPDTAPISADVGLGRKYQLASGLMEITYDSGARVILQGPVTYEVESPAGGYLSAGKLTAKLEKKAEASSSSLPPLFSVRTPTVTVTDLGTEFGVTVSEDRTTEVHVLQGVVDASIVDRHGNTRRHERVTEGSAIEVGRHDERIRATQFTPKAFVRRLRMAAATTAAPAGTGYVNTVLADKPLGYWRLGETSSIDSPNVAAPPHSRAQTASAREGVMLGGCPGALASDANRAATFDGRADCWINVRNSTPFNFDVSNPFTIEAWFKTTRNKVQGIVSKDCHIEGRNYAGYFLCLADFGSGYGPCFQMESSITQYIYKYAGGGLNDGKWHYLAATYNGGSDPSSLNLFVDGVRLASEAMQPGQSPQPLESIRNYKPLCIGARHAEMCFVGAIDEVAVYGSVLSDATIARHFKTALSGASPHEHSSSDHAAAEPGIPPPNKGDAVETK